MRKIILICFLFVSGISYSQDTPSGYTTNYNLPMWAEGAYAGATALNQTTISLDSLINVRHVQIQKLQATVVNGHALSDSVIVLTKADLGIDTTNYLNASNINTGTLALARLPATVLTTTNLDTTKIVFSDQENAFTKEQEFDIIKSTALYSTPVVISGTIIDWSLSNVFTKTLSGNTTLTFLNQRPGQMITVTITNLSTHTLGYSESTLRWSNGVAPTQSTTNKTDVYTFLYDGTYIYGAVIQNYATP